MYEVNFTLKLLLLKVTGKKTENVGKLKRGIKEAKCAVIQGRVYLCFWFVTSFNARKCMSAWSPLDTFDMLKSDSIFPHFMTGINGIAANTRM